MLVSKMAGRAIIYVSAVNKAKLNQIVWEQRFKTYDQALGWVLQRSGSSGNGGVGVSKEE